MSATPLTDKGLQKIRAIAEGNGVDPDKIELLGTDEKEITLQAETLLSLTIAINRQRISGPPHAPKGMVEIQTLPTPADIPVRIEEFRTKLNESRRWIEETVEELKAAPGQGFGIERADVTLDKMLRIFRATENCAGCSGSGTLPCDTCHGEGVVTCYQCHGEGQEICQTCYGRGHDPHDPQRYCHTCSGSTRVPCRICFGKRKTSCGRCGGRARMTCNQCAGHGKFTIEEQALPTVRCDMRVVNSVGLPTPIRRLMDKGGLKVFVKAQARIVMGEAHEGENKTTIIPYTAAFPFAELRLRILGKAMPASVIGEKAALRDLPPFLDAVFDKELEEIEKKITQSGILEKALKLRAMRDLFALMQQGGEVEKLFRRQYPVGLSATMITRVRGVLGRIVQERTFLVRAGAAGVALLVAGGIFYAVITSGLRHALAHALFPATAFMLDVLVCALAYIGIDIALRFAAATHLRSLTRQNENVSLWAQQAGALGIYVGACAVFLYAAMLWFLKATPGFFG